MAELAAGGLCSAICKKTVGKVVEVIKDIWNCNKFVDSLENTKKGELETRLHTVVTKVTIARDDQGLEIRGEVTLWIEYASAQIAAEKDFIKSRGKGTLCIGHDCNCWKRYWHAQTAKTLAEEIDRLLNKNFDQVYVSKLNPKPMAWYWKSEYVALPSMDATVEQLKRILRGGGSDKSVVVGIYGQVGFGKTTVAKKLAADMESPELRVVLANGRDDIKSIQTQIAERVGLTLIVDSVTERALLLCEKLKRTNALIIFDNVDQTINLRDIGVPQPKPANNCRIVVVSTRSNVCTAMSSQTNLEIKPLTPEESETFAAALAERYGFSNYALADIPSGKAGMPSEIFQLISTKTSPRIKPIASHSTGGVITTQPSSGGEISTSPSTGLSKHTILIDANSLQIEHVNKPEYWTRHLPQEVTPSSAEVVLIQVWYLHIEGKGIGLFPETNYGAYFVYQLRDYAKGFKTKSVELIVGGGKPKRVTLDLGKSIHDKPTEREDNWLEIEMGRFYSDDYIYSPVILVVRDHDTSTVKSGLRIHGIELRQLDLS